MTPVQALALLDETSGRRAAADVWQKLQLPAARSIALIAIVQAGRCCNSLASMVRADPLGSAPALPCAGPWPRRRTGLASPSARSSISSCPITSKPSAHAWRRDARARACRSLSSASSVSSSRAAAWPPNSPEDLEAQREMDDYADMDFNIKDDIE